MARELNINITTTADFEEIEKLAQAFDKLEASVKSLNNVKGLTGMDKSIKGAQSSIKSMTTDIKALDKALTSMNKKLSTQNLGSAANKVQANLAKQNANIAKQQQAAATQAARAQQKIVDDAIKQQNRAYAAAEKLQKKQASSTVAQAAKQQTTAYAQQDAAIKRLTVSMTKMNQLQDRQQNVAGSSNTVLNRMEQTEAAYRRTIEQMNRAWNSTDAGDQSAVQRGLSRSLGEFNAQLKQTQQLQNVWTGQVRSIQRYRDELTKAETEARQFVQQQSLAHNDAKDLEGRERAIANVAQGMQKLEGIQRKIQELDRQSTSGNEYYNRLGQEVQRYTQLIDQAGQHQAAYHQRLEQLRNIAAQNEAAWTRMGASITGFIMGLSRASAAVAQFASTLRSKLNSAFSSLSNLSKTLTTSVGSKFASMKATLDSTGKTFLGFGKSAKTGMSQANVALNEFFSAGWSLLASGSIVRMFGQNMLGNMYKGLADYQTFEQQMVRLGVSGGVWQNQQEASSTNSMRGLEDLIFGIQSGRTRNVGPDGSVSYTQGTGVKQFDASQITDALYFFSSAIGADLRNQGPATAEALKPLLQVSAFTQTDPETMIKGTLNTMMEFGYDPRALIKENRTDPFNQVAGMVAVASNVSSMEVSDVFESFKMMGPLLNKLSGATEGAGLEDAMAAIFMASEVGLKGGNVGRGLDRMVSQILDPDGPMQGVIKKYFGDDATMKNLFFNKDGTLQGGLKGVFDTLLNKGLGDAELAGMLSQLFTQNASRAAIGIIDVDKLTADASTEGSWAWFQEQMKPENITRFMSNATAAMENTVSASMTNMGNAWNMVQTEIVESVRGDLISGFTKLADVIWDIGYALRDNPALGRFVAYLGTMVGLFTTIIGSGMVLGGTILLVSRAFTMLGGMLAPVLKVLMVLPGLLMTIAPAMLAIGLAAGILYAAWEANLGGMRDSIMSFIDGLSWEGFINGVARAATTIETLGVAFMEFIRGPLLGMGTSFLTLWNVLQRVFGTWLGNLALKSMFELGYSIREFFANVKSGEGALGGLKGGLSDIVTIAQNAGNALRGLGELFFFGQAQGMNLDAIQKVGYALGIDQPIMAAIKAMDALHAAFATIRASLSELVGAWSNAWTAISGSGFDFWSVFAAAAEGAFALVMGIITGFINTFTLLGNAVTAIVDGITRKLTEIGKVGKDSTGFVADITNRFREMGVGVNEILAGIGAAIGAYLGVRLITALLPGFQLFMSLGLAAAGFGVKLVGVGAQVALFGARLVTNLVLIGVQIAATTVSLMAQAAAWAFNIMWQGLKVAADAASAASTAGVVAAQVAETTAAIGATAATAGLTASMLALDLAALPVSAIIGAVVLAVMALPIAFFAAAAGIFIFISATEGITAGFSALMDFLTAFWDVASNLQYAFMALAGAFKIMLMPLQAMGDLIGVNVSWIKVLGAAFGAAALIIGGAFVAAILVSIAPLFMAAASIMIVVKAIEFLADHFDSIAGAADSVGSTLYDVFVQIGDAVDYPIQMINALGDALERLMRYAGLSFVMKADGSGFDVIKNAAAAMIPGGPQLLRGAEIAKKGYDARPSSADIASFLEGFAGGGFTDYDEIAQASFLQARDRGAGVNYLDYTSMQQRGVYDQSDAAWLQANPNMAAPMWYTQPDAKSRMTDPSGYFTGAQRSDVSTLGDTVATSMITAYANGMESPRGGLAAISRVQDSAEQMFNDTLVPAVADTFAGQGMRNSILGEMRQSDYAVETAVQLGVKDYVSRLDDATAEAYEAEIKTGKPMAAFNAIQDYEAILGGSGGGYVPTAKNPLPKVNKPTGWKDTASNLLDTVFGEGTSDDLLDMVESFGFDLEKGTFRGLDIQSGEAISDSRTSAIMKSIFPNWENYQKALGAYEQFETFANGNVANAANDWVAMGGDPNAMFAPDIDMASKSGNAAKDIEDATDAWTKFMEELAGNFKMSDFLAPDIASGLSAVFGRTSAAGAFGSLSEGIMGNVDEDTLKANPWFNQDELLANTAISMQRTGATQSVAGKNLKDIMGPYLQKTADELGVTMDSLMVGMPQYYFDPSLLPTAQTAMFSALTKMTPDQGEILDKLGLTPEAGTGKVFSELGMDWAGLTQYAVSTAMEGKDWNLSHYLMDAWDISLPEAEAYIRQNGLDPNVINSSMFESVEAGYLSSGGQVAAMTSEMFNWLAEATDNGADRIIDITRDKFEQIPEAARIVMSNMGFAFNIVDDDSITAEVEKVTDGINAIKNASQGLKDFMSSGGMSTVNQGVMGPDGIVKGGSLSDLVGTGGNVETALNYSAMITLGIDNDAATAGLIETYNEADNTYTLLNEIDGTSITIPAPEFNAFKEGMNEIDKIIKEKYQKYVDVSKPGSANDPYGDVFGEGGGGAAVGPKSLQDWIAGGGEGTVDENGNFIMPVKSAEETLQQLTGWDLSGATTLADNSGVALAQAVQTGFSNNMASDTEMQTAIDTMLSNITSDTTGIEAAATGIATAFKTALAGAFAGGGSDSGGYQAPGFGSGGSTASGIGDSGSMTTVAQTMVTEFTTAFQTGISAITVDTSAIGTQLSTSASTWGATAGAAFAAAFAAASVNVGGTPASNNGSQDPAIAGQDTGTTQPQTISISVKVDTTALDKLKTDLTTISATPTEAKVTLEYSDFATNMSIINTNLNNVELYPAAAVVMLNMEQFNATFAVVTMDLIAMNLAIAMPQVWMDGTIFFAGVTNVTSAMTTLSTLTASPTVGIIDNASIALGNIYFLLNALTDKTVTVTTSYVTTGTPSAATGSPATIPGLASGGIVTWDGLTKVGEEGWELMDLPRGTRVFDHETSKKMVTDASMLASTPFTNVKGNSQASSSSTASVEVHIYNPVMTSNQSIKTISKQVGREIGKQIEAANKGQAPRTP